MKKILLFLITAIIINSFAFAADRETDIVKAVRIIENTIVNIIVVGVKDERTGQIRNGKRFGSGFIVDQHGIVVSNHHVIESANKIYAILSDDSVYEMNVIGSSKTLDLAVLKIINTNNRRFPRAKLGRSDNLLLGETVIAMGNPQGLNNSVTTGIVSALDRSITMEKRVAVYFQTDALINPGNSGGPLANIDGEVIGINTLKRTDSDGIGYAIPVDTLKRVLPEFLAYKTLRPSYIGFSTEEIPTRTGTKLIVKTVDPKAKIAETGLASGDEIVSLDRVRVNQRAAFQSILRSYPPKSSVTVVIKRNDKPHKLVADLMEYPDNTGLKYIKQKFGLVFKVIDGQITIVETKQKNFMQVGHILRGVNGTKVETIEELDELIINNILSKVTLNMHGDGKNYNANLGF